MEGDVQLKGFVTNVNNQLTPSTKIYCGDRCRLYAALPLLFSDGYQSTLLLSTTLIDFIIDFSKHNQLGVALLRPAEYDQGGLYIAPWALRVSAITDRGNTLPILEKLVQTTDIVTFLENGVSLRSEEGKFYYLHGIPLAGRHAGAKNVIILVTDTSEQRNEIFPNLKIAINVAIIGLVASLIMFLLVLWSPMERIKRLAHLLPLLAKSGFKEVREDLKPHAQSQILHDELDILDDTAVSLAHQLEDMDLEIRNRTTELEHLAYKDKLTSLSNRTMFLENLETAISGAKEHKRIMALLFVDLDGFKAVNDTVGHEAGDNVLIQVAQRLKGCLRPEDIIGRDQNEYISRDHEVSRLGGDEFTILLTDIEDSSIASVVTERIRLSVRAPFDFKENKIVIPADRIKNKKKSNVYLKPATAAEIKQYCANKLPNAQAFYIVLSTD